MAQILAKTPDELFKKIKPVGRIAGSKYAQTVADERKGPITISEFTDDDSPLPFKDTGIAMPSTWRYNPNNNPRYATKQFFKRPDTKQFLRELYPDEVYFAMYPEDKPK